jgi:PAS domain S-box-containing protein
MGKMSEQNPPLTAFLPQPLVQTVLDESPLCLAVLSREGQVLAMNSAGLRALELTDLHPWQSSRWSDRWPPPHQTTAQAHVRAALAGEPGRFQGLLPTEHGTPKWWDVTVRPVPDDQGQVGHLLAVMHDITAERERRRGLEQVALLHAVNTTLTVVKGEAQLLKRRLSCAAVPETIGWRPSLDRLVAAVDRLTASLSQRPAGGDGETPQRPTDQPPTTPA